MMSGTIISYACECGCMERILTILVKTDRIGLPPGPAFADSGLGNTR